MLGCEHSFTEPVDLIFVGTCSHGHSKGFFQHTTKELGEFREGYFTFVVRRNPRAKTILVISECCGQYSAEFQEGLRQEIPEIMWIFPRHTDYCAQDLRVAEVARDLIDAGIISKEK